ncbi:hypothetical protein AB7307_21220 [Providencia alcalifaciens]
MAAALRFALPAPMPKRWGRCVASRVRLRPASSPVRCSPFGLRSAAASGAALDPTPLVGAGHGHRADCQII